MGGAVVTGFEACTSLGDARTACAAARAGLSRPAMLERKVFEEQDGPVAILGHPVPAVSGFQGEARLLSLALPPLRSLASRCPGPVGLLLAAPPKTAGAIPFVDQLVSLAELTVPDPLRRRFDAGSAGLAAAIAAAQDLLVQGQAAACVVGAVDSLCDDNVVAELSAKNRLKTGDNPVGLQPGEAAVFVILELAERARSRGARPLGRILGLAFAEEPPAEDRPPMGVGISAVIRQLAGPASNERIWCLLDRNGEVDRAADWGTALHRLAERPDLSSPMQWDLAVAFGDTGCAAPALALLAALRAFDRGYAPAKSAFVLASGAGSARTGLRLEGVGQA